MDNGVFEGSIGEFTTDCDDAACELPDERVVFGAFAREALPVLVFAVEHKIRCAVEDVFAVVATEDSSAMI